MYIIWKYDQFPYKLCGEVNTKYPNGTYTVKGYDKMRFKAQREIRDNKEGAKVKRMLEKIQVKRNLELRQLNDRYDEEINMNLLLILGL